MDVKMRLLKRINKWDFSRIYEFFLNFQFVITFAWLRAWIINYLLNFYHTRVIKFILKITFIV
jgi:hypothetical protein